MVVDPNIDENTSLNNCFREKHDWRACKDEVSEPIPSPSYWINLTATLINTPSSNRWKHSNNAGSDRTTMSAPAPRMLERHYTLLIWCRSKDVLCRGGKLVGCFSRLQAELHGTLIINFAAKVSRVAF
jgi:hypothetical protein